MKGPGSGTGSGARRGVSDSGVLSADTVAATGVRVDAAAAEAVAGGTVADGVAVGGIYERVSGACGVTGIETAAAEPAAAGPVEVEPYFIAVAPDEVEECDAVDRRRNIAACEKLRSGD